MGADQSKNGLGFLCLIAGDRVAYLQSNCRRSLVGFRKAWSMLRTVVVAVLVIGVTLSISDAGYVAHIAGRAPQPCKAGGDGLATVARGDLLFFFGGGS